MTLGSNIKDNRKRCGLSQEKLAEMVGVSRQAVTKWETGQSAPSTENLIRLAEIFSVPLDALVVPVPPQPAPAEPFAPASLPIPAVPPRPAAYVPPAAPKAEKQLRKWTIWRRISLCLFIIGLIVLMPMGLYISRGGMDDRELAAFDVLAKILGVCFFGGFGCQFVDQIIRFSRKEY